MSPINALTHHSQINNTFRKISKPQPVLYSAGFHGPSNQKRKKCSRRKNSLHSKTRGLLIKSSAQGYKDKLALDGAPDSIIETLSRAYKLFFPEDSLVVAAMCADAVNYVFPERTALFFFCSPSFFPLLRRDSGSGYNFIFP